MKQCEICKKETNLYNECYGCETIICEECAIYCEPFDDIYCSKECIDCKHCCYLKHCNNNHN